MCRTCGGWDSRGSSRQWSGPRSYCGRRYGWARPRPDPGQRVTRTGSTGRTRRSASDSPKNPNLSCAGQRVFVIRGRKGTVARTIVRRRDSSALRAHVDTVGCIPDVDSVIRCVDRRSNGFPKRPPLRRSARPRRTRSLRFTLGLGFAHCTMPGRKVEPIRVNALLILNPTGVDPV